MSLTWTLHSAPGSIITGPMACNPSTGVIIMGATFGFFKSTDGGQTWSGLNPPPNAGGNLACTVGFGGGHFVAVDSGTIYISGNDGTSWTNPTTAPSLNSNIKTQIAFSPTLGTGSGMWMIIQGDVTTTAQFTTSVDTGNTWTTLASVPGFSGGPPSNSNNLFWDGTRFGFSGRDTGNSNSLIGYTSDGSTWSTVTVGSIFGSDEVQTMSYAGGSYLLGMRPSKHVRQSATLAGLATASDTDIGALLTGNSPVSAVFTPDGIVSVASIAGSSSPNVLAEQDSPSSAWIASTSPFSAAQTVFNWCYDAKHGVIVGSAGGTTPYVITAAYTLQVAVPNVVGQVLATGEANIVAAGLTVGTVTTAYSGAVPAGSIISTSPVAGTIVNVGSIVNITESLGLPTITVSPHSQSVKYGSSFLFAVTTTSPSGEACIWSVNGIVGGDSVHGTVVDGYYVAPPLPNGISSVTVTATLQTYPASDSATVTLTIPTIGGGGPGSTNNITGKFRPQKVFKPVALAKAATIPLRIYEPKENKTIKG